MKAILVLDEMPRNCEECPLMVFSNRLNVCRPQRYKMCMGTRKQMDCPLKEMPEKYNGRKEEYEIGWNDAIEEIER